MWKKRCALLMKCSAEFQLITENGKVLIRESVIGVC